MVQRRVPSNTSLEPDTLPYLNMKTYDSMAICISTSPFGARIAFGINQQNLLNMIR